MNRPRKKDRHLPRNVYQRHGAFWYVKGGKWTRIGSTLREALSTYAALYEAPNGAMPELIAKALDTILKRVKPNTQRQYRIAAHKLSRMLREFQPHELQQKDVAALKAGFVNKPNMGNRCLSVLRQVLDYAVEQQLIPSNPAVAVKRLPEKKRGRLLSVAEYQAIYSKAGPRLQVIMDLLIRTGQRVNDVLRIRRADLTEEGIRFQQQKTDAKRVVPWTPELRAVVERAKGLHQNIVALTLLHNRRGKSPDYRSVQEQWQKACAAASVTDARLHDLRAFAATWAKKQGKNPTLLLGHTSEAQTLRYLRDKEEPVAEGPSFGQSFDSAK